MIKINTLLVRLLPIIAVSFFVNSFVFNDAMAAKIKKPISKEEGDYSGLWKTGVNDAGNRLLGGDSDPHWRFVGVNNESGRPTCQIDSPGSAKVVYRKGDPYPNSLREFYEGLGNNGAGVGSGSAAEPYNDKSYWNDWVWALMPGGANWISQNSNGQHNSTPGCKDPSSHEAYSGSPGNGADFANTFTFKLDGVNITPGKGVLLDTVKLQLSAQVDNLISVEVNGEPLNPDGTKTDGTCEEFGNYLSSHKKYACTGFHDTKTINFNQEGTVFKEGANSITVKVYSTFSNIGFVITDISLTGEKEIEEPELEENTCRPITITIPEATTYPTVSHNDDGGLHQYLGRKIPINVYVKNLNTGSEVFLGKYSDRTVIDKMLQTNFLTQRFTTGDPYSVRYEDSEAHVIRYETRLVDDPDRPVYAEITYYRFDPVYDSKGKFIKFEKVFDHVDKYIAYYEKKYGWTDTFYATGSGHITNFGPCFDYKLTSKMNNFGSRVEPGATFELRPTVTSNPFTKTAWPSFWSYYHAHSKSLNTQWQITQMIIQPNQGVPPLKTESEDNMTNPCSHFDPGGISNCTSMTSGSSVFNTSGSPSSPIIGSSEIPDVLAGTKYCYGFTLFKNVHDNDGPKYNHSTFSPTDNCIVVVKKPKVQIWGGDLMVGRSSSTSSSSGGSIKTSISVKSGKTYGSWVEYAALASGNIEGIASGSAFNDDSLNILGSNDVCKYSKITFTNAGNALSCSNSTPKGFYSSGGMIPDIASGFPVINGSLPGGNLSSVGSGNYGTSGNINISGGDIEKGKTIIINTNSDVTISGDIKYTTASMNNLGEIPQVVIIARNISIEKNVTNIDAWLVASGNLNTCSEGGLTGSLTINHCSQKLTINGPVVANKLYLRRTAGSGVGPDSGKPAEVFNLRADAYLWAYGKARENGSIQTVFSTEMPVRF